MDQELPNNKLGLIPAKASIRVTESHLPGVKACKGSVTFRQTLTLDDIARRTCEHRTEYRKDTLTSTFRTMLEEIYLAIEDGFNIDFGLGRIEVTVNGSFESLFSKFDREEHTLAPRLRPSPRLRQCVGRIPAENHRLDPPGPLVNNVSLSIEPYDRDSGELFNQIPAGKHHFVSIYGSHLKLAGDHPDVGLTIRCCETDESYSFAPQDLIINSGPRLCFPTDFVFSPGEWEAVIRTQLAPDRRLYKSVRMACITFSVQ